MLGDFISVISGSVLSLQFEEYFIIKYVWGCMQ